MTERTPDIPYRGRFAPSPTGPLHLGSLLAAVGSYIDAKLNHGKWFVRIDDIDTPRVVPDADSEILRCLEACGLHWDDSVIYQSTQLDYYQQALETLASRQHLFYCSCSRAEIAAQQIKSNADIYPGTCREKTQRHDTDCAIRVKVDDRFIIFEDRYQGNIRHRIDQTIGDFVVKRRDGLFAYQLAIVVDDARQQITDVIRGVDLIDSTPRQIFLQQLLGYVVPQYGHLPILINKDKQKLSKQTHAPPVDYSEPSKALIRIFSLLGQHPPERLEQASADDCWQWAMEHWKTEKTPTSMHIYAPFDDE